MDSNSQNVIFVSGSTATDRLGKSITAALSEQKECFVRCIGANAGWQTTKGIIVATSLCAAKGIGFSAKWYFKDVLINEKLTTAVEYHLVVEKS